MKKVLFPLEESLEAYLILFLLFYLYKKKKIDIKKSYKFSNKVRQFNAEQVDSLIAQLDELNLNKFDNEVVFRLS